MLEKGRLPGAHRKARHHRLFVRDDLLGGRHGAHVDLRCVDLEAVDPADAGLEGVLSHVARVREHGFDLPHVDRIREKEARALRVHVCASLGDELAQCGPRMRRTMFRWGSGRSQPTTRSSGRSITRVSGGSQNMSQLQRSRRSAGESPMPGYYAGRLGPFG